MQRSSFHKGEELPLRVPAVIIAPVTSKCDGRERSSESGTGDQDAMVRAEARLALCPQRAWTRSFGFALTEVRP